MVDNIFKIGLLILGTLFLITYMRNSQNGRYQYSENLRMDTRTGVVYLVDGRKYGSGLYDIIDPNTKRTLEDDKKNAAKANQTPKSWDEIIAESMVPASEERTLKKEKAAVNTNDHRKSLDDIAKETGFIK